MAMTKMKGDLGEAIILADILRRGYKVVFPVGEDWNCDLIVLKGQVLEKAQCKYTESKNGVISVKCGSCNNWVNKKYSKKEFCLLASF